MKKIFFLLLFPGILVNAQKLELMGGVKIPLVYSVGTEYNLTKSINASIYAGFLTYPFKKAILDILEAFDTDEILLNTIGEAFSYGYEIQPGFRFWIKKYYTGFYYSYFTLVANESPADAIENYYGINIPDRISGVSKELTLKLFTHNAGILVGREFTFKNPHISLRAELSFAKTIASKSELFGEDGIYPKLSEVINNEIKDYIFEYGYLPSINIYFVYKLTK